MKRFLILTAGFGDGHNTAARNTAEALRRRSPEAVIEIADLIANGYGPFNRFCQKAHLSLVAHTPTLWRALYGILDLPVTSTFLTHLLQRVRRRLEAAVQQFAPDCVVATYPVSGLLVRHMAGPEGQSPFPFVTVITDSISVNGAWYRGYSDYYCVANPETSAVLAKAGIPAGRIKALGFPVSPDFACAPASLPGPDALGRCHVLLLANSGRRKVSRLVKRLLNLPEVRLTVVTGRNTELRERLSKHTDRYPQRLRVLGWTNDMPALLGSHHIVITKAGGATVQEAIAARCPMILSQVIPGQEEGNASYVASHGLGRVAERRRAIPELVRDFLADDARPWHAARKALNRVTQPEASLHIADLLLSLCDRPRRVRIPLEGAGGLVLSEAHARRE
jgi:UDP-N-acetylglucosamine:LPS N-acetylglucosamine transferase